MSRKILVLVVVLLLLPSLCFATKGRQVEFMLSGLWADGMALNAGKVYTYTAGTTSAKALYTNADMTEIASNPVILDSNGRYVAYGNGLYKFVVTDSLGTTVFTANDVDLTSISDFSATSVNPFGVTLYQKNIISSSVVSLSATIGSFTVTGYLNVIGSISINAASVTSLIATLGADLGANNHKITSLAPGTAVGDAVNVGQLNAFSASATGYQLFSSTGATNFTVPVGVSKIWVTCVSGGGGGGGIASAATITPSAGGGGSGGSVYRFEVSSTSVVIPGAVWTITVGAGGAGGIGLAGGTNGGLTSVYYGATLIVLCTGGIGGSALTIDGATGGGAGTVSVIDLAAKVSGGGAGGDGRHYDLSSSLHAAFGPEGGSNPFGAGAGTHAHIYNPASYTAGLSAQGWAGTGRGAGGSGAVGYQSASTGGQGTNGFVLLEW